MSHQATQPDAVHVNAVHIGAAGSVQAARGRVRDIAEPCGTAGRSDAASRRLGGA